MELPGSSPTESDAPRGSSRERLRRFDVDLGETAVHVPAGARLRIEISSSNFPKYTRSSSTADRAEVAGKLEKAQQTVWHSLEHRSRIVLPMLK